jgi:AcrR family transcriptional regulator
MQRPKEHVRAKIVSAAASLFAEVGYEATTIAGVAERAGSSVGNVYKYFASKEELFQAVLPEEFAEEVRRKTEARIKALGTVRDLKVLAPSARYHVLADELLDYCLAHRERVIILLARAKGTPFESFADDFANKLVRWALDYAAQAWPELSPSAAMRFSLRRIYQSYLTSIATAFSTFEKQDVLRETVSHLTAHHQGGLKNLFEIAAGTASSPKREGGTRP